LGSDAGPVHSYSCQPSTFHRTLPSSGPSPTFSEEQYGKLEKYALRPGDIVLTRKGSLGKARLVPRDIQRGIADSDTIRIRMNGGRPTRELMVRLLHEAEYLQVQIEINSRGAILGGLNTATIGSLVIAVPGDEEARIIQFLESETAKVDTLIAKQERLIELLQEKRQALISHAVTKGLNPDAPMKPSGVEWLGDVPAHWKLMKLKNFSTLQRGHDLTDAERTEGLYPVVTSGGISGTHGAFMARGPGVVTGTTVSAPSFPRTSSHG
jgi:hypothetical protein